MTNDFINLSDYSTSKLGVTGQVGYYYFYGLGGYPELGTGLRTNGDPFTLHSLKIHKDDAEVFRRRIEAYRKKIVGEG